MICRTSCIYSGAKCSPASVRRWYWLPSLVDSSGRTSTTLASILIHTWSVESSNSMNAWNSVYFVWFRVPKKGIRNGRSAKNSWKHRCYISAYICGRAGKSKQKADRVAKLCLLNRRKSQGKRNVWRQIEKI